MGPLAKVVRLGEGVYRVETDGRAETVYVVGAPGDEWVFWNGDVFRTEPRPPSTRVRREVGHDNVQLVTAPMAAKVAKVLVQPGATVRKGQTLLVLEAMKMELPVRSTADASVTAVHCREGERVQHDALLVELR